MICGTKDTAFMWLVPEGKGKENEAERVFERNMAEKLSNLTKETNLQTQETANHIQHKPKEIYTKCIIIKLLKSKGTAVCLRKLKQGLCINLEGWVGEGDGRDIQEGGDIYTHTHTHTYTYGWFMLRFDRKQQNSVKQLSFN